MSMDAVFIRMQQLCIGLQEFNDRLKLSIEEVNEQHDRVNGQWQDSMRRQYDARWLPLKETMDAYVTTVGPQYVEMLQARLQQLTQYLHGHER